MLTNLPSASAQTHKTRTRPVNPFLTGRWKNREKVSFGCRRIPSRLHKKSAGSNELVATAIGAGINFFDNCWEYHDGLSEESWALR